MTQEQAEALLAGKGIAVWERAGKHIWICRYCNQTAPFDWDKVTVKHAETCLVPEAEEAVRHCGLPQDYWIRNAPGRDYGGATPWCLMCSKEPIVGNSPKRHDAPLLCGFCQENYSGFFVGSKGGVGGEPQWIGWRRHWLLQPLWKALTAEDATLKLTIGGSCSEGCEPCGGTGFADDPNYNMKMPCKACHARWSERVVAMSPVSMAARFALEWPCGHPGAGAVHRSKWGSCYYGPEGAPCAAAGRGQSDDEDDDEDDDEPEAIDG